MLFTPKLSFWLGDWNLVKVSFTQSSKFKAMKWSLELREEIDHSKFQDQSSKQGNDIDFGFLRIHVG